MVLDLGCKIIAKPNNSLSAKDNVLLLISIATVSLLIAVSFARIGAWMVLPFAGLEVVAFAYAFNYVYLHSADFESITIEDESVVVEKRYYKDITKTVFHRYWARVSVRAVGVDGKRGLFISSHGKEVEFGEYLIDDEQRMSLAQAIKKKLKYVD